MNQNIIIIIIINHDLFLMHFFSNLWRETNEEKRAMDRMHNDIYSDVRQAAEAHRQVQTLHEHKEFLCYLLAEPLKFLLIIWLMCGLLVKATSKHLK